MFAVRRLLAVGSVLMLLGLLVSSQIWGQARRPPTLLDSGKAQPIDNTPVDPYAVADRDLSRFADQPLALYYRPDTKETLMAVQVKPSLDAVAARPRDYLVMLDTAAHLGRDLQIAKDLTQQILLQVGAEDRVALWTVNTRSHDLTNGFQPCKEFAAAVKELNEKRRAEREKKPAPVTAAAAAEHGAKGGAEACRKLSDALKKVEAEYPAGAVNLATGLPEALKLFDGQKDRQHVILFLGSGQSIAGPIDADLRAKLCKDMVANHIAFYSVPLGGHLDPYNLHGFANSTGGKIVRYGLGNTPERWIAGLKQALAQPILYDAELQLPAKVAEVLPSKLPPLRPDVPTLVVGKFAGEPAAEARLDYTLTGKVGGEAKTVKVSEKMPRAEEDNFFLVNMIDQWKTQKDRPALLQADRALAYAYENNQLARADLLAQAEWAVEKKKYDVAQRLYKQALEADPTSVRAKAGLRIVEDLRSGKIKFDDLKNLVKFKKDAKYGFINPDTPKLELGGGGKVVQVDAEKLFADPDKPDNQPLAPDKANQDRILQDVKARQQIVAQEQTQIVNDAIRQANRLVRTRPEDAHDFLKRTLDDVQNNPELTREVRASLSDRLQRALQSIDIQGAVVKRDQDEALRLLANANARTTLSAAEKLEQNKVAENMRVYHNLMDQAREQQAYRHAQAIRADLINQGLPVPPAVTGAYASALAGYHLREEQELRRIRQERWLNVLLEVERSHIPFPDEPPVEYPPAAQWKALSEFRKGRYESATFGADMPARGIELRNQLAKPVKFDGVEQGRATLAEVLDVLAKRYHLTFDINEQGFKLEGVMDVASTPITADSAIPEMNTTLSTVLRKILRRVAVPSGATYLIRKDVIEITTGQFAGAEKTVRVYPVADLVTPIPNAFNPMMLAQSATIFGMSYGALGGFAGIGGLRGIGMMGALGGVGGMVGMAGNLGGLGGVGGIAGLGGQGFQNLGAAGNQGMGGFQGGFQGQGNMGNGGIAGFGGQNLGQFGNLGGQFGLQGGNQSSLLITLIRQVVGRPSDWAVNYDPVTGKPLDPLNDNDGAAAADNIRGENNQLGFFPPAQALAVKASSTIHTRSSNLIINAPMGNAALPGPRDPNVRVAGHGDERKDLDPRKVWQDALSKGVKNPSLIIATADFLVLANKHEHAVEFLKANLRQGIVMEPWVYKALTLALQLSGGSTEDIERAEVSVADMEPKNANGYLQAAQALARDEKYGLALAFCRQAALREPGTPQAYEDALGYAELARDPQAMQWAAGNLLRRDWPVDNAKIHDRALQKLEALAKLLEQQGRKEESERLLNSVGDTRVRDLVVRLNWQGNASLDLHVIEPTGSTCTPLQRQTIGGGVLIGDSLAGTTSETYLAADAFSGEYEIEIEKIWGHPLGDKVQLKIIQHQGTPDEREQLLTVEMKSRTSQRIKVKLDDGRRRETAYVPPADARKKRGSADAAPDNPDKVFHELRRLADPEITGVSRGFSCGVATPGARTVLPSQLKEGKRPPLPGDNDRMLYQTRVKPFVQNALDVTAQAVLSADRRYVRLSMTPVFNTMTGVQTVPIVVNPTIPGVR
jgi:tetratricopeptide (TPR) repeat protein